ncbi:hypothetical protein [Nocardiopsis trehalosi]|jgi:hypothetical protein|uniref:hypothetical protein n=1 Tax=Nocardiopsis trehalosi TaxID=109329 RepID=UPI00082FD4A9|nr:hypothetical protein [Nocardiopsis trehalosi]
MATTTGEGRWPAKPLAAMTAAELTAAQEELARIAPEDTALHLALRAELVRAVLAEAADAAGELVAT